MFYEKSEADVPGLYDSADGSSDLLAACEADERDTFVLSQSFR